MLFRETSAYYKSDSQTPNNEKRLIQGIRYHKMTLKIMKKCLTGSKLGYKVL